MSDGITDAARQTELALKAYREKMTTSRHSTELEEIGISVILQELKRRYKSEMAIRDYVEMIECEVVALEENKRCTLP